MSGIHPVPVTVTRIPVLPVDGVIVNSGAPKVNVAVAVLAAVSVTVTVYVPVVRVLGMVNVTADEVGIFPSTRVVTPAVVPVYSVTEVVPIVMVAVFKAPNPQPVRVTSVPTTPAFGVRVILGTAVTVCEYVFPLASVTMSVWLPPVTVLGEVKVQ